MKKIAQRRKESSLLIGVGPAIVRLVSEFGP